MNDPIISRVRTCRFSSPCDDNIEKFEVTFDGLCLAMIKPPSEVDEYEAHNKKYKLDRIQITNCETNNSEYLYVIICAFRKQESNLFSSEGKAECAILLIFIHYPRSIMVILQSLLAMSSH
jgi:hypothetical protein